MFECNISRTRANAKAALARFVLVVVVRQTAGKLLASVVAVNDICSGTGLELLRTFPPPPSTMAKDSRQLMVKSLRPE